MVAPVVLRRLRLDDEDAVLAAHRTMQTEDDFPFLLGWTEGVDWAVFVRRTEEHRLGVNVAPGLVPSTFLVAEVDGAIAGRVSIRHQLNDFLRHEGGHIGYCVLRPFRGRGVASEILRQALEVARDVGVDRALLCCADDNLVSARIIERAGGAMENLVIDHVGKPTRRYWIG